MLIKAQSQSAGFSQTQKDLTSYTINNSLAGTVSSQHVFLLGVTFVIIDENFCQHIRVIYLYEYSS